MYWLAPLCLLYLAVLGLAVATLIVELAVLWRLRGVVRVSRGLAQVLLGVRGPVVLALRDAHVREVLVDHERFTVALYDGKMRGTLGPFLLGREFTDEYKREIAALRRAMRPGERIRAQARELAEKAIGKARDGRPHRIDVIGAFAHEVVPRCIGTYFGFEPTTAAGQPVRELAQLILAGYVFHPFPGLLHPFSSARMQVEARRAGEAIGKHLDDAIVRHVGTDDVIGRLLEAGLERDAVR